MNEEIELLEAIAKKLDINLDAYFKNNNQGDEP